MAGQLNIKYVFLSSCIADVALVVYNFVFRTLFGVKANTRNNIAFAENSVVVYPAGQYLVKSHVVTKQQEFMAIGDGSVGGEVSCMAVSNSRRYCAVAEKRIPGMAVGDGTEDKPAIVTIYNLRTLSKRKTLIALPHAEVTEFTCLSFNLDDTLLLALTGAPSWQLVLFSVEKGRCLGVTSVITQSLLAGAPLGSSPIPYGCSFSPISLTKAVVYGRSILSFYNLEDLSSAKEKGSAEEEAEDALTIAINEAPPSPLFQSRNVRLGGQPAALEYTAQAWLGDDLSVFATAQGELLLFRRDQFLRVCLNSQPTLSSTLRSCMMHNSSSFAESRCFSQGQSSHRCYRWVFPRFCHGRRKRIGPRV